MLVAECIWWLFYAAELHAYHRHQYHVGLTHMLTLGIVQFLFIWVLYLVTRSEHEEPRRDVYITVCCHCPHRDYSLHSITRFGLSSDLASALPQLPLLRKLELSRSSFGNDSLAAAMRLPQFQELIIDNLGRTTAEGYAGLPSSLTRFELRDMPQLSLTGKHAAGLAALTQLRHLEIHEIGGLAAVCVEQYDAAHALALAGLAASCFTANAAAAGCAGRDAASAASAASACVGGSVKPYGRCCNTVDRTGGIYAADISTLQQHVLLSRCACVLSVLGADAELLPVT
jgi:hypothetical protein